MKPQPILGDMPWHIKQKIADDSDIVSQMNLRLCSKEFRRLVSTAETHYDYICLWAVPYLTLFNGRCSSDLNRYLFSYNHSQQRSTIQSELFEFGPVRRHFQNLDFVSATVDRLARVFQNPKTFTRKLQVILFVHGHPANNIRLLSGISDFVRTRPGRLNVEELSVAVDNNPQDVLTVISLVRPGTLRSIAISNYLSRGDTVRPHFLQEVCETEQWKQAKELRLLSSLRLDIPHEKWSHLKMDSIPIGWLTIELLKKVLDSFAWNPEWRDTEIKYQSDNHEEIKEYFRGVFEVVEDEDMTKNRWRMDVNGAGKDLVYVNFKTSHIQLWKLPKR